LPQRRRRRDDRATATGEGAIAAISESVDPSSRPEDVVAYPSRLERKQIPKDHQRLTAKLESGAA